MMDTNTMSPVAEFELRGVIAVLRRQVRVIIYTFLADLRDGGRVSDFGDADLCRLSADICRSGAEEHS